MRTWATLSNERRVLYGAVGLRLVDVLTDAAPMGRVEAFLDVRDGASWREAGSRVLVSSTGIVTAPGLERKAQPVGTAQRRYRLRLSAQLYRPLYRVIEDGVEFDAFPYNDDVPPQSFARIATDELLAPNGAYPFEPHVRLLRGRVVDGATGEPVEDALVHEGLNDRAVTDAQGAFVLPLRTAPEGVAVTITVDHPRSLKAGSTTVTLPADLATRPTIQIF